MSTLINDFRSLVFNLCERRDVPLLVTDMIADCLVRRDLFKINTVSRSLNEQANATIYRDVVVNLHGSEKSVKIASLLFRTLLTSESAARAVRTLSLTGDPLHDWREEMHDQNRSDQTTEGPFSRNTPPAMHADLTDFTQEEAELYDVIAASPFASMSPPASEVSVWAIYLQLFPLAPHIQDFSVSSDYFRFPGFRNILEDMARDSSMQKLRSCSLCLDLMKGNNRHECAVADWDSVLLSLLAVRDIESFAAIVSLEPEVVRQLRPGGNSITRLSLHHYQWQESDLGSLLAATPSLRYLEYHAITNYSWLGTAYDQEATSGFKVGLEPLYDALNLVSHSLQELHMSEEFVEDCCHFSPAYAVFYEPPFRQREELSGLKRLHALTIPYTTLLGWYYRECVWDWDKTLPPSLRRIVLRDDLVSSCFGDEWDDECLLPVISGLVEWLSAPQRGNETAEFGMLLNHGWDNFNEPVRQQVARMGEDRGVRCWIDKVGEDRPRPDGWRSSMAKSRERSRSPTGGRGGGRGRGRIRGSLSGY